MAIYKVLNKVKTDAGYDILNPMTPFGVIKCTATLTNATTITLEPELPQENFDASNGIYCTFSNENITSVGNGASIIIYGTTYTEKDSSQGLALSYLASYVNSTRITVFIDSSTNTYLTMNVNAFSAKTADEISGIAKENLSYAGVVSEGSILTFLEDLPAPSGGIIRVTSNVTGTPVSNSAYIGIFYKFVDESVTVSLNIDGGASYRSWYQNTRSATGTWSGWSTSILPLSLGGTGATTASQGLINLNGVPGYNGINIAANTDLNSLTTTGFYKCTANATTTTLSNSPTKQAFAMIVLQNAGQTQILIKHNANTISSHGRIYYRNLYSGTWSPWWELFTTKSGVPANKVNSGTLVSDVKATNGTDYTTSRLRNIYAGTGDLTAGTSSLANGSIYLMYQ